MRDIADFMATAGSDSLVVILGLFIVGGIVSQLLFRKHPMGRAIVRIVFLVLLTIAFVRADVVPYHPLQRTGSPFHDAAHAALKIAWWFWAAWFLVGFLRAVVIVERRPRENRLIQELLAGLTYLAAVFAIIAYVFDLPIQGLLATSGVLAIILGLALQSTLSDVFSGVVLSLSRPYLPGDWVNLDGGTDGRVIEMNWRATHILTGRRDLAIVPNSTIAKSKIVNVSSPSGIHGTTVTVQLDGKTPPGFGSEILANAILNCRLIVATPAPSVVVKSITARYTEFDITFFVEHLASAVGAQNRLFDLIFRHLSVAGIRLAAPLDQPGRNNEDGQPLLEKTAAENLLELVPIFGSLTGGERNAIAAKLRPASYDQGDILLEPGLTLKSLFIIGGGVLSASRDDAEGEIELERLGPGDHYGEIGMLTGAPSIVKITALLPAIVYELAKEDLAPILEAQPQVAHELCRALARHQTAIRLTASAEIDESLPTNRLTAWFFERLHRLSDVASAQ